LKRVFDQNGVLLDDKQGLTINLVSTDERTFFSKFSMYSLQDENTIKRE